MKLLCSACLSFGRFGNCVLVYISVSLLCMNYFYGVVGVVVCFLLLLLCASHCVF